MTVLFPLLAVIATVLVATSASRRFGLSAPLVLTLVGVAGSFLPFLPDIHLEPDLVLVGILPPLLYAAAIRSSIVDFRDNRVAIVLLSVGLVVFTALGVGVVTWWLLPIPFAAAFALGAVVGPPDAVSATAIARQIGLPRRLVTLLEGESLVNDATALVLLGTAIAAIRGTVTPGEVAVDFIVSAGGGILFGVVVAVVVNQVHRRSSDPVTNTALSLITPFLAFLPAQAIHSSGVLAVVVAGLLVADRAPRLQNAASRLSSKTNWSAIAFLLENSVFLIIGLQVSTILGDAAASEAGIGSAVLVCAVVLATVILLRPVWVLLTRSLTVRPESDEAAGGTPLAKSTVLSWAGMRGVVTLAAAFTLPAQTPHREVLVLAAMVVTAGTLLIQGSTLPLLARRLGVRGPGGRADALQEAAVLHSAVIAGLDELDRQSRSADPEIVQRLRADAARRTDVVQERVGDGDRGGAESPTQTYRRLRLRMLIAEREAVLRIRDAGEADTDVLQHIMYAFDMEESLLGQTDERTRELTEEPPTDPGAPLG